MTPPIELRGMTWDHPRGIDPLVAHAKQYEASHSVKITWDARLLEDFETYPLAELADRYDMLVIDHPHVGAAAASGCLLPLEPQSHNHSVGYSHQSYYFEDKQWALAIDAAAQVSCQRTGSFKFWPVKWDQVDELMREGRALCPLAPVHALMCFFTLCANESDPCATSGPKLVEREIAESVLARLGLWASLLPEFCFTLNPIGAFERMLANEQFIYVPLIYGYVTYAGGRKGEAKLEFGDIPGIGGSTLGGTGIAVSARSKHVDVARAIAEDLASAAVQRGVYASAGGQPAHRDAWTDPTLNVDANGFYRKTLSTLEHAYVRPRFDGYVAFQHAAGECVASCLKGDATIASTIDRLNDLFAHAQGL